MVEGTKREATEAWGLRLGLVAGISERATGSLGQWTEDTVDIVSTRWREFRRGFQSRFPALQMAHQVHGARVLWHEHVGQGWHVADDADGHATTQRGVLLAVTVADCVPVYLADTKGRGAALLHAGWRGVAGGMLRQGTNVLCERAGAATRDLAVHLGPAICGSCYEVGEDVARALLGDAAPAGKSQVDLRAVLSVQASALGIGDTSTSPFCTRCDNARFFSHRAGDAGRQVAYLGKEVES